MGNGPSHGRPSEEHVVETLFDVEDDDINRAIELSLAESQSKGKNVIDESSSLDEDEQLAIATQESLNILDEDEDDQLGIEQESLDIEFSPHYQRGTISNLLAFSRRNPNRTRCAVCMRPIPSKPRNASRYMLDGFWNQQFCTKHLRDGTPRCCSCQRMEPRNDEYLSLDDGRKLCLQCLNTAIMDTNECQPLFHEILHFYEGLNMRITQEIPMLLVQRHTLNEAMDVEKIASHNLPEVRGLCLAEEQIVRSISRRPRIGGNRISGLETRPNRLVRCCEVTAILVIYGLPRPITGSILAHELMHAYMRLNGFRNIPLPIEEGICNVLAHMWLEAETMSGSSRRGRSYKGKRSEFDKQIGHFSKLMIEKDPSRVYGDGFRAAYEAVSNNGLRSVLDHVRATGQLPD